jgi:TetR/AcrR family transcriptional regulator, transcriptional repressor for nem operon
MGRTSDARQQLLEAAIHLIRTSTYGAVSVDQICLQAGVKKGSFYHFFPSKEDLALAAFDRHFEAEIEPELERVFAPTVPPLQRLLGWCEAIYREQRNFFELYGRVPGCPLCTLGSEAGPESERLRKKAEELLERSHRHLVQAIGDALDQGLIPPCDKEAKARLITHLMLGAELQARVQNDPERLRELGAEVLDFLVGQRSA